MALDAMNFGDDSAAERAPHLRRARRARRHLALLLMLSVAACSGDDKTPDDDGKSSGSANADDYDDDDNSSKKDAGSSTKKDAGSSGGTMRADGGRLDAGSSGGSSKPDASGPDTGTKKTDSSTGASTGGGACSRDSLKAVTNQYYEALAAHDPSMLPLADDVKFTENGEVLELGEGLWKTAGMLKYKHSALDVETCSTVSESVVPDGSMDIPLGLRLKLDGEKISEIETIAIRPGDYVVFGIPFASNTGAIIASASLKWEEDIPADKRNTRDEIEHWLTKYFKMFNMGGCNFANDCQRLENGGGSFECSAALTCSNSEPGPGPGAMNPRLIVVDVDKGIGVGFTMFAGNTDFHMIKMYGGEIHAVHAILGAAANSGWD